MRWANEIAAAIPGGTVGNSCVGSGVTTPAYVYQAQAPTVNATNTTNVVPPSESAQSGNPVPINGSSEYESTDEYDKYD